MLAKYTKLSTIDYVGSQTDQVAPYGLNQPQTTEDCHCRMWSRHGTARQGTARHGTARQGYLIRDETEKLGHGSPSADSLPVPIVFNVHLQLVDFFLVVRILRQRQLLFMAFEINEKYSTTRDKWREFEKKKIAYSKKNTA